MKIESLMKEVAGIADDLNSMGAVKAALMADGILFKIAANYAREADKPITYVYFVTSDNVKPHRFTREYASSEDATEHATKYIHDLGTNAIIHVWHDPISEADHGFHACISLAHPHDEVKIDQINTHDDNNDRLARREQTKFAQQAHYMDEVVIKGRTPEQKKAIVKQLNSKVQAYINEILKYQGKPPTSTGDGRMTPGDMEWLKQNVGGYKTWGELFQKLKPLLGQAESLEAVPPDFENPAQKMNEHYDGQLKEDISTMRGDTAKYTKSLGA